MLQKISRFKVNAPRSDNRKKDDTKSKEISDLKAHNERLIFAQNKVKAKLADIEMKISSIEASIEDFEDNLNDI